MSCVFYFKKKIRIWTRMKVVHFMPTTRRFLRWFGLYPSENISQTGIRDTLYIIVVSLPLWFVLLTSYAYFEANIKTADIAVITDNMYTNFIFTMMCGNYYLLTLRKFGIREIIDEMQAMLKISEFNSAIFYVKHVRNRIVHCRTFEERHFNVRRSKWTKWIFH